MNRPHLPALAAVLLLLPFSSCSGKKDAPSLAKTLSDCTEWCASAWQEPTPQQVCRDACREYADRFRQCAEAEETCAGARSCALQKLRQACAREGPHVQTCEDSGRFAHNLTFEVCESQP